MLHPIDAQRLHTRELGRRMRHPIGQQHRCPGLLQHGLLALWWVGWVEGEITAACFENAE